MIKTLVAGIALCVASTAFAQSKGTVATWSAKPAHAWAAPTHMMLLDATHAGKRMRRLGAPGGDRSFGLGERR